VVRKSRPNPKPYRRSQGGWRSQRAKEIRPLRRAETGYGLALQDPLRANELAINARGATSARIAPIIVDGNVSALVEDDAGMK
jgi:hypothetical protein